MNSRVSFLLLILSFIYSANAAYAPFITKCKTDDSNCIKDMTNKAIPIFANGIPELGVEKMDPLFIKSLDATNPILKLQLWDVSGTGLKDCVATKMGLDVEKLQLSMSLECDVDFIGKYEMKGRLLVVPIEGNGDAHVALDNVSIQVTATIGDKVDSEGVKHWTIKSWTHSYDVKGKSIIELQNLFNGNELLAHAAREVIKSRSNEIVKNVGPPIVKGVIAKIVENIGNFFDHVPAEELVY